MITILETEINAAATYSLSGTYDVTGPSSLAPPIMVTFRFRDAHGQELEGPIKGFQTSETYSAFLHVGRPGQSGAVTVDETVTPPEGAASATLIVHRWRAREVAETQPLAFTKMSTAGAQILSDPRLLHSAGRACDPGEVYEFSARFNRPLQPREIVAAVRFRSSSGDEIDADGAPPKSDELGFFHYLAPWGTESGFAKFHAPPGARHIDVSVYRWANDSTLELITADLTARGDRADLMARGDADVEANSLYALQADIHIRGPQKLVFAFDVFDADGRLVAGGIEELGKTAEFDAYAEHVPETLERHDGRAQVQVPLTTPVGSKTIRWSMLLPDGGRHHLASPPQLAPVSAATPPKWYATSVDLQARAADTLQNSETDFDTHLRGGERLGRLAFDVTPGAWVRLVGHCRRRNGGLHRATLALRTAFFAADGTPITDIAMPGFGHTDDLGSHRFVWVHPLDPQGVHADFDAPLWCPQNAAFAVVDLVAAHSNSKIALSIFEARRTTAQTVCGSAPISRLSRPQLVQALNVAEHANDQVSSFLILQALSVVDPGTKGFAYRARKLGERLTCWTLPDATGHAARPDHVMVLSDRQHPAETLAAKLAKGGMSPAIGLTSNCTNQATGRTGHSFPCNRNVLPGRAWDTVSPADRAEIEAHQFSAALLRHNADLLHLISSGSEQTAEIGAALSRAFDIPFVLDLSFSENVPASGDASWNNADAVLVPPYWNLQPSEQRRPIFRLPYALDDAFEAPGNDTKVTQLRQILSLGTSPVVGLVLGSDTCDAWVRDVASTLAETHHDVVILILPSGDSANEIVPSTEGWGARVLNADPNRQADPAVWYRLCTVIAPARDLSVAQHVKAALNAMSQDVAVVMADSRASASFAGSSDKRLSLADASDAAAFGKAIANLLRQPAVRAEQARHAADWVRSECGWPQRLNVVREAYAAVRDGHAKGRSA